MSATVKAEDMLAALVKKHDRDLFVPECNTGSSWAGCRRMDAWVLKRTWSPVESIGYEIKVSRSDFEADQKWMEYLEYTHKFYFVCPAGLIRAQDLPTGVGLIWMSKAGNLHTKIKAAYRRPEPEKLAEIMTYVLMSRSIICADYHEANAKRAPGREGRMEMYRRLVEQATARKDLASFVRGNIHEILALSRSKLERAQMIEKNCEEITKYTQSIGVDVASWQALSATKKALGMDAADEAVYELVTVGRSIARAIEGIKRKLAEGAGEATK